MEDRPRVILIGSGCPTASRKSQSVNYVIRIITKFQLNPTTIHASYETIAMVNSRFVVVPSKLKERKLSDNFYVFPAGSSVTEKRKDHPATSDDTAARRQRYMRETRS